MSYLMTTNHCDWQMITTRTDKMTQCCVSGGQEVHKWQGLTNDSPLDLLWTRRSWMTGTDQCPGRQWWWARGHQCVGAHGWGQGWEWGRSSPHLAPEGGCRTSMHSPSSYGKHHPGNYGNQQNVAESLRKLAISHERFGCENGYSPSVLSC